MGFGSRTELPDLCRVCVLADGRAKATFSDNTIMVTNSAGSAFLAITADGQSTRQLSEYALARHSPLLAALLEFRNMHVDLPCFCKPLARALRSSFTLGYLVRDATWPSAVSDMVAAGLARCQPDGKVAVSSEDGVAQVVLHGHRRRFAVCYPLLVAERPQEGKYEYVWQTQVFSTCSYPPRWEPAVQAALRAATQLEASSTRTMQQQQQQQAEVQPYLSTSASMRDPNATDSGLPHPDHPSAPAPVLLLPEPAASRCSELPRADDCTRVGITQPLSPDGWWAEPSLSLLPQGEVLALEWTPQATYQYLPQHDEVEVWVHADESCLATTRAGRFLAHVRDPTRGGGQDQGQLGTGLVGQQAEAAMGAAVEAPCEQLYAASCVPEMVWSRDQSCRYPLAALAAHALKLRSHNSAVLSSAAAAATAAAHGSVVSGPWHSTPCPPFPSTTSTSDALFAVSSTAVVEESCVPGHGSFVAYEDGRVRVCFDDRAILHLSASHTHAKVVLPDGGPPRVVAVANPVGVERYVTSALEFAAWAFKSPAERAEELRAQARVRAELLSCQRMARLCDFATSGVVPVEAGAVCVVQGGGGRGALCGMQKEEREWEVRPGMGAGAGAGGGEVWAVDGGVGGGGGEVAAGDGGVGGGGGAGLWGGEGEGDMQALVERLLQQNARLLERL